MPFLLDTAAYEQSADEQKENGSQAIWLGSHPEASGHGSSKRRASRGISGFSSLGKIHGLMNQFA